MDKRQSYKLGVDSGLEAAQFGDFTAGELQDEDAFFDACFEVCENKRQYAGHAGDHFHGQRNSEELWDAFERGEAVGIRKGWANRRREVRKTRREA